MKPITEQRRQELIADLEEVIKVETHSLYGIAARIALASLTAVRHQWSNGCNLWVPRALRYLAENERPGGGNLFFNTEHLYQLAGELERSMSFPLYTAPPGPVINLADITAAIAESDEAQDLSGSQMEIIATDIFKRLSGVANG